MAKGMKTTDSVAITEELIAAVAKNARLTLTSEEITHFKAEVQEILAAFKVLDEVDTERIKPSFRPIEERNHMREDTPKPGLTQKEALKFTEDHDDGFFVGPKTVD